jgi:transposase-like protein
MRYALFKRPLETLSAAWKGFGLHPRKLFSSSKHVKSVYKRGNAEDDRKILELSQEGLTTPQIAQQLPDYTYQNVAWRLQYLRAGPTPTSTGGRWQLHEDAVLKEKREVGVQWGQIMPSLPGRTIKAAQSRYYNLKHNETVSPHGDKKRKPWSLEEKQRVIDMRIVDKMSIVAISKHLGRTYSTTAQTWHRYGHAVLPADVTRTVRKENQWTVEQDRVFTELRASGHTYEDILESQSKPCGSGPKGWKSPR